VDFSCRCNYTARVDALAKARRIARDCLGVRLRVLARVVTHLFEAEMSHLGVKIGQMNLLVAIATHGEASPSDLSRGLELEKSTMSRDLKYLQAQKWITITRAGRRQVVRITAAGLAIIDRGYADWTVAQKNVEAALGPVLAAAVAESVNRRWQAT
jgi:DNA-binding MarR family transcriptional regulator